MTRPPQALSAPHAASDHGPSQWVLLRRLLGLSWRYRWFCLLLLILQGILLGTALGGLQLGGLGIDVVRFHLGEQAEAPRLPWGLPWPAAESPLTQVALIALGILGLAVLRGVLNYVYAVVAGHVIHRRIVVDLRTEVYDKLQRLSFRFFDGQASGSIINRVTSDVQAVRAFVDGVLVQFVVLVLSLVCYLAFMLSLHVGLTLACLATTPLLWWLTVRFSRRVRPEYDAHRAQVDQLVLLLAENLQGAAVVRGFGREPEEIARFARANDAVRDQQQNVFWRVSTFAPLAQQLTQLNLVILLAYGGYLVSLEQLSLGAGLVVFAGLLQQFASQVGHLSTIANSVQQSLSGARRVFEILDAPIDIQSPPIPVRWTRPRGEIRFEQVGFEYQPGVAVLEQIDLHVAPGQKVALLGVTGAGKSTLLSLIPRFHDPTRGRILIDGHDLRTLDLGDLRQALGIVFQESFLFSNTIAANIAFGHPAATREQIERAARIAAAAEFIERLPDGYDTELGEHGLNLSGGQRQRLAIARAILLDPPILLLDDPAAAIDPQTEQEILLSLRQATAQRTTLIIAHRLSTLRDADLVVVLERGRIIQMGRHEELLATSGHYREVARSQASAGTFLPPAIDAASRDFAASTGSSRHGSGGEQPGGPSARGGR
ncbi:MAG: ABC transporter ATP-binding protein [Pirellulales bacterium]